MANPIYIRGATFRGSANLKQDDGIDPNNISPYVIPPGAVVEAHFPPDPTAVTPSTLPPPVILSTANPGEITLSNNNTTVTWSGSPVKSLLLGVGKSLTVGVKVIRDPTTLPQPLQVDYFEKQKVIDVKDPDNP